uniref:Baculoviral IAP repeat-containing protein 3 n=1 Tax=Phallusia mammillata TaxID=59560 RepID=A0A6F9D883_9ASCI|nr:baculoviral IAP repeat-containing protein 3 [Phallusia mammillata]
MEADSTRSTTTLRKEIRESKGNSDEGKALFPCQKPITASMALFPARIRTFISWPQHLVAATAVVIAQAGFFYLQERDRVKCYYCNGGLQNWKKDDDPWFEHAKWFPHCEHVLHCKGIEYVEEIGRQFPNIKRPVMPGSSKSVQQLANGNGNRNHEDEGSSFNSELHRFLESKVAKDVEVLGFSKENIAKVGTRRYKQYRNFFSDASDLISALIDLEDETKSCNETQNSLTCQLKNLHLYEEAPCPSNNVSNTSLQTAIVPVSKDGTLKQKVVKRPNHQNNDLSEQLLSLRQDNLCKICLDRKINCVMMNCRHMCCCLECAASVKRCPICREKLVSIFKFYR